MSYTASEIVPEKIVGEICKHYRVSQSQIASKYRGRDIAFVRQLTAEVLRQRTELSLSQIGKIVNRDHTTIIHGKKVVQNSIDTDYRKDEILYFLNREY